MCHTGTSTLLGSEDPSFILEVGQEVVALCWGKAATVENRNPASPNIHYTPRFPRISVYFGILS